MTAKLMAEIFSDAIAASRRPTMSGLAGRECRGYITVNQEFVDALLFAQKELVCKSNRFGSYDCGTTTAYGFDADMCLTAEINSLNSEGITTIGCCCGHGRKRGYIQVVPGECDKMLKLGYEPRPVKSEHYATSCFIPKTILPKPAETTDEYFQDSGVVKRRGE